MLDFNSSKQKLDSDVQQSKRCIKRLVLKISGEMLGGGGYGIKGQSIDKIATQIKGVCDQRYEVAIVIGGGNIFRGSQAAGLGMDRSSADYIGMMATVINGLALQSVLEKKHALKTRVMTAIHISELAEPYIRRKAISHLEKGKVVIFVAGTGNPLFTTDTAAALRAREIGADILLKATKVDGIYSEDPINNPQAERYEVLSYLDVISRKLNIMDATSVTMCMEANLPICVFKMQTEGCILAAITSKIGTIVRNI